MYVLIVLVAFATNGASQPTSIATAEFNSQKACEQAGNTAVQLARSVNPNFAGAGFRCVAKD